MYGHVHYQVFFIITVKYQLGSSNSGSFNFIIYLRHTYTPLMAPYLTYDFFMFYVGMYIYEYLLCISCELCRDI